jgi:cobalt-zinc-cadmium efflux system outer membrane protein
MRMGTMALAVCALACVDAASAAAQGRSVTLADVLARAREHAPRIVSARLALEETRARAIGAAPRLQHNPELDAWVGSRNGPADRSTDFELGVAQAFEPGARRTARVDGARAAMAESEAAVDEATRAVLRQAAAAYARALYAGERIALLDAAYALASNIYSTADRRYRAGDLAVLDVNIARASLARVRAEREAAEATKALALGDLRQLLDWPDEISVEGSLRPAVPVDLDAALQAASERSDLRALEAGIREAEAQFRLGMSFSKPELGLGARYSREAGDRIVLGGMTITLPMFSKGQEQRALGSARAARLRAELDAARTRARIEVRAAFDAYSRRLAAIRALEADAIPGLDENERLTLRSFEVGQLGLPDLLLIRRETLEIRFAYLDALLEAALARIDLEASAGVLR